MDQGEPPPVEAAVAPPTVSVIVPVWNAATHLRECIDSVLAQTMGVDRIELIAVDDGSTDESAAILDEYAATSPTVVVIREPNSGGPGRPRNVGLDRATGRFVFFLDADDYLGSEALQRLVAMAERNAADVVLGKMVGIGGRRVPGRVFTRNRDRASLDEAYTTLSVLKLFRRSLIERLGLRFAEGISAHEDGQFTARVYLASARISILADYDVYYCRRSSRSRRPIAVRRWLAILAERMANVEHYTRPGLGRERLTVQHVAQVSMAFSSRWLALPPGDRRRAFDAGSELVRRRHIELIQRLLPAWIAIRAYALMHGLVTELEDIAACPTGIAVRDPIVDGRRIFARFPHFRDGSGIPDQCFDITRQVVPIVCLDGAAIVHDVFELRGRAYLRLLGGATTVELVRWPAGARRRFDTNVVPTPDLRDRIVRYPDAGFQVSIDLSGNSRYPIRSGIYRVVVSVGTDRVLRAVAVRRPSSLDLGEASRESPGIAAVLYRTPSHEVRLRIGQPGRLERWLEPAAFLIAHASWTATRVATRAINRFQVGRLLGAAMEELRPGVASGRFSH